MIRIVEFKNHPVSGEDKRYIGCLIKGINKNFKQRKQYDEYYFTPYQSNINEFIIENLSNDYVIEMSYSTLVIYN